MSSPQTQQLPATRATPPSSIPAKPGWDDLPTFTGVAKIFGWLTAATFTVPLRGGRSVHMHAELPGVRGLLRCGARRRCPLRAVVAIAAE